YLQDEEHGKRYDDRGRDEAQDLHEEDVEENENQRCYDTGEPAWVPDLVREEHQGLISLTDAGVQQPGRAADKPPRDEERESGCSVVLAWNRRKVEGIPGE